MNNKLKNSKGITLISLMVTIIALLIVSNMTIYSVKDSLGIGRLKDMQNDIENLNDKISAYYNQYGTLPIINEEYTNIIRNLIQNCRKLGVKFRTGDPLLIPIFSEVWGIDIEKDDLSKIYAGCQAGDEIIYIDYKGNVGACSYIPKFADNIKDKPLDEILSKNKLFIDLRAYKNKLEGKCKECKYKMICGHSFVTHGLLYKNLTFLSTRFFDFFVFFLLL